MSSAHASDDANIRIRHAIIGHSLADKVKYIKDPDHELSLSDIISGKDLQFEQSSSRRKNFRYTNATIWVKGTLENHMEDAQSFFFEASRPITNLVRVYWIRDGKVIDTMKAGDHMPFHQRSIKNRKNLFPIDLQKWEELGFVIELQSHGEALVFPLIVWTPQAFFRQNSTEQLNYGLYYGVLFFVFLVFGFFYQVLRDNSFLYYILYILCFGLLQFSIDGFSYRFFFSSSPWLADRIILFSSALTILFLVLYARTYLKVPERERGLDKAFKTFMGIGGGLFVVSMIPVEVAWFCNPTLNLFSFIAVIFVLFSIFYLKRNGFEISNLFMVAYLLLIAGAITFILGNTGFTESTPFTLNALKFGSFGEVVLLSYTMARKYRDIQKEKEKAQSQALARMEQLNNVKDEHNRELESKVAHRTEELDQERAKLDQINREMMSSIRYAERIQRAILPHSFQFDKMFEEWFVFFRPRDIVSGDIYWGGTISPSDEADAETPLLGKDMDPEEMNGKEEKVDPIRVFSVMDCTGHGVPGAFLTFLGQSMLDRTKKENQVRTPAEALTYLDQHLRTTLSGMGSKDQVNDGMDMGLCTFDPSSMRLEFAGANNDCYIIREGRIHILEGDRKGIGGDENDPEKSFIDQVSILQKGDVVYLFSDGYPDQFGGPKGKKFKYKPFRELLISLQEYPLSQQKEELERVLKEWQGDYEQVDDICILGVKV